MIIDWEGILNLLLLAVAKSYSQVKFKTAFLLEQLNCIIKKEAVRKGRTAPVLYSYLMDKFVFNGKHLFCNCLKFRCLVLAE